MPDRPGSEDTTHEESSAGGATLPDRAISLGSDDTLAATPQTTARTPTSGDRIGRFLVEKELGRGGMGAVVAAHDPTLDRKVAIKVLHEAHGASQRRLLREAQALARLAHPNVVAVHEVGTIGDRVFVAMEYVDGQTLREWMEARRPWREVVEVFVQAGRGLDAAHAVGLVHRDFKPDNVLIRGDGRVLVTDFGLAAVAASTPSGERTPVPSLDSPSGVTPLDVRMTRTGALVGTPAYMSPEQHDGAAVGPASDQFSFCVSLFEGLFGRRPFGADHYRELLARITRGAVRVPARTDVPRHVQDALLRGLRPRPEDRFPSMKALLDALKLDPDAATAPPPRGRGLAIGLTGAAIGLAGVAVVAALALTGSGEDRRCAGADRKLAGAWDAKVRDAVARAFQATGRPGDPAAFERVAASLDRYAERLTAERIEACEATHVRKTQPVEVLELRTSCLDRRQTELAAYTALLAGGLDATALDRAIEGADRLPRIEDCADLDWLRTVGKTGIDGATRSRIEELHGRLASARNLIIAGRYQEAAESAAAVAEEAEALHHPSLRAEALLRQGGAEEELGDPRAAEQTFRTALRAAAEGGDDRLIAELWGRLIMTVGSYQARTEDALAMRESAEIAITAAGEEPRSASQVYNALGNLYAIAGNPEESRRYLERALAMRESAFGSDHSETANVLNNLGLTLLDLGRIPEARAALERAARIFEDRHGADHPNTAMALDGLGLTYWAEGRLDEARRYIEQALERRRRALGEDHLEVARGMNNLGNVLLELGDHEAALPYLERAGRRFEAIYGADHPDVAGSHANVGLVRLKQQRWDDALREGELAVRGFEKALGADHVVVAYGLLVVGSADLGLGRPGDAVPPLARAVALRERGGAPHELAEAKFVLARALDAAGRDRAGAIAQARAARELYAAQGEGRADEVAEIDDWLSRRRSR